MMVHERVRTSQSQRSHIYYMDIQLQQEETKTSSKSLPLSRYTTIRFRQR